MNIINDTEASNSESISDARILADPVNQYVAAFATIRTATVAREAAPATSAIRGCRLAGSIL